MIGKLYPCPTCGINQVRDPEQQCGECLYERMTEMQRELPGEFQDWEFAYCEECGSSLDNKGHCRNTWCSASPYQGTDWL